MKKIILSAIAISALSFNNSALAQQWNIGKSTHFILYYKNAPVKFTDDVLEKAEYYYDNIAEDLGFTRYNFWLWDNRAKIYIYDDVEDYKATTGQPYWSSGYASVKDKIIETYPLARGFFDSLLPHELGHIIFREFVGFKNIGIPLWMDEGVATYQERKKRFAARRYVRGTLGSNKFIPLDRLSDINIGKVNDNETVNIFYLESVCLIDYLIVEFGKENFVNFCRALRDSETLEEAISRVYPFRNLNELNSGWLRFLRNE